MTRSIRLRTLTRDAGIGYNRRMVAMDDQQVAVLVVTGPTRARLAELFTRVFEGRHDVRVVAERRAGERRSSPARVAVERRRGERRVSAPWLVIPPA